MPDKTAELAGLITDAMNHTVSKKTREYDTTATVSRIETKEDGSKQTWVSIPGGVIETPVRAGVSLKPGDEVQVHVGGGRAFIQGNYTSPPTDDTRANQAYGVASNALDSAVVAKTAADSAVESAEIADEAAGQAKKDAEDASKAAGVARESADTAFEAARSALVHLADIEDVVGTVEWIAEHGQYGLTTDTEVIDGRTYFTVTGEAVSNPTGNPHAQSYYERTGTSPDYVYELTIDTSVDHQKTYYTIIATMQSNVPAVYYLSSDSAVVAEKTYYEYVGGIYILSEDTEVVEDKTYYEKVGGDYIEIENPDPEDNPHDEGWYEYVEYLKIEDPQPEDDPSIEGWYEYGTNPLANGLYQLVSVDEAIQTYISTHLALMDDGLHVINDNKSGYLLISPDSVKIKDKYNNTLAEYGEGTVIGNTNGMHIEIGENQVWGFDEPVIGFYNGDSSVNPPLSYISSSGLSIPHAVIVTSLQIGEAGSGAWKWVVGDEQDITAARHLKLMWVGGN